MTCRDKGFGFIFSPWLRKYRIFRTKCVAMKDYSFLDLPTVNRYMLRLVRGLRLGFLE